MNKILLANEINFSFLGDLWNDFVNVLPKILLAIAIVIIAWIILKIVLMILKKVLKATKIDTLNDKLNEIALFGKSDYSLVPSKIVLTFVKYFLLLIFTVIGAELLGLTMLTKGIGEFIAYLPILISALAIFIIGIYLASLIKRGVENALKSMELNGSKLISNLIFYVIVVMVSITALNQAGINTDIITSNITIILGALLLAVSIAFGLGSKEIIQRLLFGFYSRKNLTVGQTITIGDRKGVIVSIDNISLKLKTADGTFIYPIKEINDRVIEIEESKN